MSASSTSLLAGRYALRKKIAAGGHATIYEAEDAKLGRVVAVKVLAKDLAQVPQEIQRIEREARVTASISHPNVCSVTDVGRLENGSPFVVQELLAGETLGARLKRDAKIALDDALAIGEQILLGLAAAHARGVIHRDVKPDNVFLVPLYKSKVQVKLIDFGIAQVPDGAPVDRETLTVTGVVIGTAEYMSPEQLRGVRDLDARSDVYSAAVVLYEMLSGQRPFAGRPVSDVLQAIAFEQAPPLASRAPALSETLTRAVDVALANARERRHANAMVFLDALTATAPPARTGVTSVVSRPASEAPKAPEASAARPPAYDPWEATTLENRPPAPPPPRDFAADVKTEVIPKGPRK